jgi:hypothetical protein
MNDNQKVLYLLDLLQAVISGLKLVITLNRDPLVLTSLETIINETNLRIKNLY